MENRLTDEEITDRYFTTMARELCGRAEVCHEKCNSKCNAYKYAVRAYAKGYRKQNIKTPGDVKPCTMCPAVAKLER